VWRASALLLALGLALGLALRPAHAAPGPAGALARQIADELAAIDRARSTVGAKLAAADARRARRLAAAYRLLRPPAGAPDGGGMVAARRRAAVRLLLERQLAERRLLAAEDAQLLRAAADKQAAAARLPELALPAEIGRPARGKIVRRFGTIHHERSNTRLARRGIDLEVEAGAPAVAPEAGVVRYAGPIRGLGTGVIIDHGSFLTVIAKLGAPAVPAGAPVRRGDRIGRAAHRRIYLEVRAKLGAGGLPIDPEPLLPRPDRAGPEERKPRPARGPRSPSPR
jgi:murein hydrolase activator